MTSRRSLSLAQEAMEELLQTVSKHKSEDAGSFIEVLENLKMQWKHGTPRQTARLNMVDRAIKFVHEAYDECEQKEQDNDSEDVSSRVTEHLNDVYEPHDFKNKHKDLRKTILNKLVDLKEELGTVIPMICQQAMEHIHANEIVMTSGYSTTVVEFCKKVRSQGRRFHIIVAESDPATAAHSMSKALASASIDTTLILESNVFALMARVNKVVIGADVVTADGGIIAPVGTFGICLAAHHYQVPVLVCAGMYKVTPRILCSYDLDSFNHMGPASTVAEYSDGAMVRHARCINPLYDYVPPSLVSILITNTESYAPPNIYRAVADLYTEVTS
eukprot:gene9436-1678_t